MSTKELEIQNGNKLIAEFMGYEKDNIGEWYNFPARRSTKRVMPEDMQYHTSWDWLMPVVEKIEAFTCLGIDKTYLQINDRSCAIWTYFDVTEFLRLTGDGKFKVKHSAKTKIEATYNACVDFIQWYTSLTPKSKEQ